MKFKWFYHKTLILIMYVCTFVDSTVLDSQLFVPGYSIFRKDNACPRGELLIYIKHDLCCCCRTDL